MLHTCAVALNSYMISVPREALYVMNDWKCGRSHLTHTVYCTGSSSPPRPNGEG